MVKYKLDDDAYKLQYCYVHRQAVNIESPFQSMKTMAYIFMCMQSLYFTSTLTSIKILTLSNAFFFRVNNYSFDREYLMTYSLNWEYFMIYPINHDQS